MLSPGDGTTGKTLKIEISKGNMKKSQKGAMKNRIIKICFVLVPKI